MTAKKAPEPGCTVDVGQFLELLTDVARASSTDPTLPMINGVLLHGDTYDGKSLLVATATDRFILAHASVNATGAPLPESFIRLDDVKRIIAVLRTLPRGSTLLEIGTSKDKAVRFSAREASVTADPPFDPPSNFGFVSFRKLFEVETPAKDANQVGVNGVLLSRLTAVARSRREYMHIRVAGRNQPTVVQIGQRFRALIMPVRTDEPDALPVFVPPSESAKEAVVTKKTTQRSRRSATPPATPRRAAAARKSA